MKRYFFIAILSLPLALSAADKYTEQMTRSINAVYKAQTPAEYQEAINSFERIGSAEKTKWEPFYYASFGYILLAAEADVSRKDALLDQAQSALDKAAAIRPEDSEIFALEGFITMIRLTVDPSTRGPQYSMKAMQSFGHAVALNPNNPRALALMAQMQLGTAQFFQQQPTEACATASKALEMFASTTPSEPLSPAWGKEMTQGILANCK